MADVTLAVVSVTFQLFAGCIKGYQLLSEAINLPTEYKYVRMRLEIEQSRLLDWGRFVEVSESGGTLSIGRVSKGVVLEVLEQQHELLLKFGRYDDRLRPIQEPILAEVPKQTYNAKREGPNMYLPQSQDLWKRALSYADTTRNLPNRLRWVVCDKAKIEALLCKLSSLNNFLMELLDKNQLDQLLQMQARTNYGIMQLNSNLGQLLSILQADSLQGTQISFDAGQSVHHIIPSLNTPEAQHRLQVDSVQSTLGSLARTKAFNLVAEEGELTESFAKDIGLGEMAGEIISVELNSDHFEFQDASIQPGCELEYPRTEAILSSSGLQTDRKHVWVEWRLQPRRTASQANSWCYSRNNGSTPSVETTHNRMAALAAMLRQNKSSKLFRAAYCLGFFYERVPNRFLNVDLNQPCYGIVFEKPLGDQRPVSLLELLRRNQQNNGPLSTPSLTQRVRLAVAVTEHIERLHAVNWLHKAIRSYNILFFAKDTIHGGASMWQDHSSQFFDLGQPFLSGFELSRPVSQRTWSAAGLENPAHDIYRHPDIQAASAQARDGIFKKSHDYYSLGIVLLEVAYWKPIDAIVGLKLENSQLKDTYPIRSWLLQDRQILQHVKSNAGEIFFEAIKTCIAGAHAFGLSETDDEADPMIAARLQCEFYVRVVQKLKQISI